MPLKWVSAWEPGGGKSRMANIPDTARGITKPLDQSPFLFKAVQIGLSDLFHPKFL